MLSFFFVIGDVHQSALNLEKSAHTHIYTHARVSPAATESAAPPGELLMLEAHKTVCDYIFIYLLTNRLTEIN